MGDTLQGGDTRPKLLKVAVMSKKGCEFFQEKIGVTPAVAAPGDTNPSDATEQHDTVTCSFIFPQL